MFRVRFHTILKRNNSTGRESSSMRYVGCSIREFKKYLEKQFLPEMNWDNHEEIWG